MSRRRSVRLERSRQQTRSAKSVAVTGTGVPVHPRHQHPKPHSSAPDCKAREIRDDRNELCRLNGLRNVHVCRLCSVPQRGECWLESCLLTFRYEYKPPEASRTEP